LKVRMLTLMPLNYVPGEAATAEAEAAGADGWDVAGGVEAPGDDAVGDGLAEALHPDSTRIGMIAAATKRYRDTDGGPPLDIRRRSFSILNGWRSAGQYGPAAAKVKIPHAVQPAGRAAAGWQRRMERTDDRRMAGGGGARRGE
jgi:hypothetical protein